MTTTPTPTSGAADLPEALRRSTAADGKTELFNLPGYPLMVRAVDFNRLHTESEMRRTALLDEMQKAALAAGQATTAQEVVPADQDDSLHLCASDLQHSAIYDNHVEMQSCMRAVAERITALASAPAQPTRDLEAVIKAAADKLNAAVCCHPNAADTLIHEALEILDGDSEPAAATAQAVAILFEHEDGRYAVNPNTTGDPAWHRLGPVDISALAFVPAQPATPLAYGATEYGWTDHRRLEDGDKRLMALIVSLYGNDHQSYSDLEGLLGRAFRATPAQPAAQQGVAYAELPAPNYPKSGGFPGTFAEAQMRAFADATHSLRVESLAAAYCEELDKLSQRNYELRLASHGQAPAPADSVQEDAARLDWLLLRISGAEFRRLGVHYSGNARRADVDAARKQGETK